MAPTRGFFPVSRREKMALVVTGSEDRVPAPRSRASWRREGPVPETKQPLLAADARLVRPKAGRSARNGFAQGTCRRQLHVDKGAVRGTPSPSNIGQRQDSGVRLDDPVSPCHRPVQMKGGRGVLSRRDGGTRTCARSGPLPLTRPHQRGPRLEMPQGARRWGSAHPFSSVKALQERTPSRQKSVVPPSV